MTQVGLVFASDALLGGHGSNCNLEFTAERAPRNLLNLGGLVIDFSLYGAGMCAAHGWKDSRTPNTRNGYSRALAVSRVACSEIEMSTGTSARIESGPRTTTSELSELEGQWTAFDT